MNRGKPAGRGAGGSWLVLRDMLRSAAGSAQLQRE